MNNLRKMQEALEQRRAAGIKNKPPENNLIKRYGLKEGTRKESIFMMCFSCEGGDIDNMPDSGWKRAIGDCTILDCPLQKWRPYQRK